MLKADILVLISQVKPGKTWIKVDFTWMKQIKIGRIYQFFGFTSFWIYQFLDLPVFWIYQFLDLTIFWIYKFFYQFFGFTSLPVFGFSSFFDLPVCNLFDFEQPIMANLLHLRITQHVFI